MSTKNTDNPVCYNINLRKLHPAKKLKNKHNLIKIQKSKIVKKPKLQLLEEVNSLRTTLK